VYQTAFFVWRLFLHALYHDSYTPATYGNDSTTSSGLLVRLRSYSIQPTRNLAAPSRTPRRPTRRTRHYPVTWICSIQQECVVPAWVDHQGQSNCTTHLAIASGQETQHVTLPSHLLFPQPIQSKVLLGFARLRLAGLRPVWQSKQLANIDSSSSWSTFRILFFFCSTSYSYAALPIARAGVASWT